MSACRDCILDERDRVDQTILLARVHLYNTGRACGAAELRRFLIEQEALSPTPSLSKIGSVLREYGLTHGRLGWDDDVEPQRLFFFIKKPKEGVSV